jgi:hypothetical protein
LVKIDHLSVESGHIPQVQVPWALPRNRGCESWEI